MIFASLALFLWGAGAFLLPLLAENRLRATLRDLGFTEVSIGAVEADLGSVAFRTIAFDPDSLSAIGAIEAHFSLPDLVFRGKLRDVTISGVALTADYSEGNPLTLAGWSGSFSGQGGAFSVHDLPFERLTLRNASLDIATDAGGIGMSGDAAITTGTDGTVALQAQIKGAQYQASFALSVKGTLDKNGAWTFAAEIADGKIALDALKVSRIAGWLDIKSGTDGRPASLTGQIAAGMIASGLIRLQEMTATLEGTPAAPRVTIDGKAAGVPGLTFRATLPGDGTASAAIIPEKPGDLAEYLRLAGEASGQPLDPSLIPRTFSGLNLQISRDTAPVQNDTARRFTLKLSDTDKTLSLRSDLLWDGTQRSLSGTIETGAVPAVLATRLYPALLPDGWSATNGTLSIQGQFSAANDKNRNLKISGPVRLILDKIDLENEEKKTISDLSGRIVFENLLPLATKGFQKITAARADLGLPLETVQIRVSIGSNGSTEVQDASAALAGGTVSADPVRLMPGKPFPPIALHIRDVDLEKTARAFSAKDLKTSGIVDGDLTLTRDKAGRFSLRGKLTGRAPGGLIRYDPETVPAFLSGDDPGLETTRQALRDFRYDNLSLDIDGPLDGSLKAQISASGTNPAAFGTRPIELNLAIEGAIAPLLRLSPGQ